MPPIGMWAASWMVCPLTWTMPVRSLAASSRPRARDTVWMAAESP